MNEPWIGGMGATPYPGGCAFRVWAPHADSVSVVGDFNGWYPDANHLTHEGNGYWYATVEGAHAGQQYKFRIHTGWRQLDKVDPYAARVTHSAGNGIIYNHGDFDWQGDDFRLANHNDLIIYEAHVGTLMTRWGGGPGGFEQVIHKLGHLNHLGVNALQLMPVMEFPGDYSWGYNPSHMFAVKSTYGGPDMLKLLVREAHRYGIAIIMDVVYNHFGPTDLDLWQFDGWSIDDRGGIYFYPDERAWTPWGNTRPDFGRDEVRRFIHDNAMMWLYDYHVDGLRYDMTPYIRSIGAGTDNDIPEGWEMIRRINLDIRNSYPGRITIAEDLLGDSRITGEEDESAAFHSQWDANFVHTVRAALTAYNDRDRSVAEVVGAISDKLDNDVFSRVIYTENHDEVSNGHARLVSEISPHDHHGWHALKRSTLGAALVFTSPGIPMIFQGQEFAQDGWFGDDRPIDWWLNEVNHGIVNLYRDLIALRLDARGGTAGLKGQGLRIIHASEESKVIAFQRFEHHGVGDDVVVVVNLSGENRMGYTIGMPAPGLWSLRFNSDSRMYSPLFSEQGSGDVVATPGDYDGMDAKATLGVGGYSVLVYAYHG